MSLYTTKTGSKVLGIKQDTLKRYAREFGVGSQPGGPGTPHLFTREDLLEIKDIRDHKWYRVEDLEDREELGLPPVFDPSVIKDNHGRRKYDRVSKRGAKRAIESAGEVTGEGDGPEYESGSEAVREDQED